MSARARRASAGDAPSFDLFPSCDRCDSARAARSRARAGCGDAPRAKDMVTSSWIGAAPPALLFSAAWKAPASSAAPIECTVGWSALSAAGGAKRPVVPRAVAAAAHSESTRWRSWEQTKE